MVFKTNTSQQLSLDDSFISLTAREKRHWRTHGRGFSLMRFSRLLTRNVSLFYIVIKLPGRIPRWMWSLVPLSSKNSLITRMMKLLKIWCWISISSMPSTQRVLKRSPFQIKRWVGSGKDAMIMKHFMEWIFTMIVWRILAACSWSIPTSQNWLFSS